MTTSTMLHLARVGRAFAADESGATAIEYAMIAAGIGTAIAATVWTLGAKVNGLFASVNNKL
jgi:pilus assembly protein Flp/PilA